jgi:hypothetical protein
VPQYFQTILKKTSILCMTLVNIKWCNRWKIAIWDIKEVFFKVLHANWNLPTASPWLAIRQQAFTRKQAKCITWLVLQTTLWIWDDIFIEELHKPGIRLELFSCKLHLLWVTVF